MKLSKLTYFGIGVVTLFGAYLFFMTRPTVCRFKIPSEFRIGTVAYGCFTEYIPQTGILEIDSVMRCHNVRLDIDELYLPRIAPGLKGTTIINDTLYTLAITNVDPTVKGGRFTVDMNFCDEIPSSAHEKLLRLRIELNEPSDEILLPVGSFYKDTGGRWIYVVENGNLAVRRSIKLGRKSGAEYFEVLEGLKPGEKVITSSYERFDSLDSLDLVELKRFDRI